MIDLRKYEKIGEREGFDIYKMRGKDVYAAKKPGADPFKILKAEAIGVEPIRRKEN